MVGSVFGETTPSITGNEVIGDSEENHAIHVFFDDTKRGFWFVPELLEVIDHASGAEIRLKGVPTATWIRSPTGGWEKIDAVDVKPWWETDELGNKDAAIRIRRGLPWIGIGAVLEGLVFILLFPQDSIRRLTTWQIVLEYTLVPFESIVSLFGFVFQQLPLPLFRVGAILVFGVAFFTQAAVFGLLIWVLSYMVQRRQKDRNPRPSSPP